MKWWFEKKIREHISVDEWFEDKIREHFGSEQWFEMTPRRIEIIGPLWEAKFLILKKQGRMEFSNCEDHGYDGIVTYRDNHGMAMDWEYVTIKPRKINIYKLLERK